jgi:FlaA1/EpsC-like NDP-sugar epimerase
MSMQLRNRHFLVSDVALLAAAPLVAYALRFEGFSWEPAHARTAVIYTLAVLPLQIAIFSALGLYRRLWRYASIAELESVFVAVSTAAAASVMLGAVVLPALRLTPVRIPLSVLAIQSLLGFAVVATPRLIDRVAGWRSGRRRARAYRRVLIAGAGAAGEMVVKELRTNPELGMQPIGFVDDDPNKQRMHLADLPIFGPLALIPQIVDRQKVQELVIAMPRASGSVVRSVVQAGYEAGVRTRTIPGLFEILGGRVSVTAIRDVRIEDLLRREPVQTDLTAVAEMTTGRTVLVTGAGGSIGSELCRQLTALEPERLLLLGHGENSIFDIVQELLRAGMAGSIVPVIADIRDAERIRQVFLAHRPHAVFHAAAHKHVPLMEENVIEAVTNNVVGTRNVVDAARACAAMHLVFISTDKAVRPTNVMGASKRVAEYVVHNAAIANGRNFVSVRFGNVLGSRGSVVPTFVQQIRAGGPVTVTHPEMRRYFMTIPEAVQLVLQAGALGKGGELFMLDMGEPIKIADLARDMIRLSGLQEGSDIEICFTGLRPGEKLLEEMFFSHEVAAPTEHPKILRARNGERQHASETAIALLIEAATGGADESHLRRLLHAVVPDFRTVSSASADHSQFRPRTPAELDRLNERDLDLRVRRAPLRTLGRSTMSKGGDTPSAAAPG